MKLALASGAIPLTIRKKKAEQLKSDWFLDPSSHNDKKVGALREEPYKKQLVFF